MVTQSELLTSARPSGQATVTPAGQLSQMGIAATERGTGFGFDWGQGLHFFVVCNVHKGTLSGRYFLASNDRLE